MPKEIPIKREPEKPNRDSTQIKIIRARLRDITHMFDFCHLNEMYTEDIVDNAFDCLISNYDYESKSKDSPKWKFPKESEISKEDVWMKANWFNGPWVDIGLTVEESDKSYNERLNKYKQKLGEYNRWKEENKENIEYTLKVREERKQKRKQRKLQKLKNRQKNLEKEIAELKKTDEN